MHTAGITPLFAPMANISQFCVQIWSREGIGHRLFQTINTLLKTNLHENATIQYSYYKYKLSPRKSHRQKNKQNRKSNARLCFLVTTDSATLPIVGISCAPMPSAFCSRAPNKWSLLGRQGIIKPLGPKKPKGWKLRASLA